MSGQAAVWALTVLIIKVNIVISVKLWVCTYTKPRRNIKMAIWNHQAHCSCNLACDLEICVFWVACFSWPRILAEVTIQPIQIIRLTVCEVCAWFDDLQVVSSIRVVCLSWPWMSLLRPQFNGTLMFQEMSVHGYLWFQFAINICWMNGSL